VFKHIEEYAACDPLVSREHESSVLSDQLCSDSDDLEMNDPFSNPGWNRTSAGKSEYYKMTSQNLLIKNWNEVR
jgi:hypothetical protein